MLYCEVEIIKIKKQYRSAFPRQGFVSNVVDHKPLTSGEMSFS